MSLPNQLRRARSACRLALTAALALAGSLAACGSTSSVGSAPPPPTATSAPTTSGTTTPAPTSRPYTPPTEEPPGTPATTVVDGVTLTSLVLGGDIYPIDVVEAFDSIWIANHHTDDVSRMDPATMEIVATVEAGAGPGWFAVTDDAIWVSNQNSSGVTRIDPATNRSVGLIGDDAPCWRPTVAAGSVWQPACDANVYMRIDPATNAVTRIAADRRFDLVVIDGVLYAGGETGLARFDEASGEFVAIDDCCGTAVVIGADGSAIWLSNDFAVNRFDPSTGMLPDTLALSSARFAKVGGDRAYVTLEGGTLVEIDRESGEIVRRIKLSQTAMPLAVTEAAIWVTAREEDIVWRVQR